LIGQRKDLAQFTSDFRELLPGSTFSQNEDAKPHRAETCSLFHGVAYGARLSLNLTDGQNRKGGRAFHVRPSESRGGLDLRVSHTAYSAMADITEMKRIIARWSIMVMLSPLTASTMISVNPT
jgi:hypothetical protein